MRLVLLVLGMWLIAAAPVQAQSGGQAGPGYADESTCQSCHTANVEAWRGSHHFHAMEPASEASVRGDFADKVFLLRGKESRFFRRGGKYFVRTEAIDGKMQDFEISHTFGYEPLQQYLISFPDGRRQALTIAWDTVAKRWFDLYADRPAETAAGQDLHWTGRLNNWNHTCAYCHSTDLSKGFDISGNRFQTRWQQINVGCQACHGPAGDHVARAKSSEDLSKMSGFKIKVKDLKSPQLTEICATCHARRRQIAEGYRPGDNFLDAFIPATLRAELYHADGQIDDEVYVYGSFLQSRMYAAGVKCTDCHDPHSGRTKAEGNGLCTQCHNETPPAKFAGLRKKNYDDPAHHFHKAGQAGSQCVDCHMAAKNFMTVDPRRDHGFRIPDPALAKATGAPNACLSCHEAKSNDWAAAEIERRHGKHARARHFGYALHAGRQGAPAAAAELIALVQDPAQPAIVRASAADLLAGRQDRQALTGLVKALSDPSPLLRLAALRAAAQLPQQMSARMAGPSLGDPVRAVRIEALKTLSWLPKERLNPAQRALFEAAEKDYLASEALHSDRAESYYNIANFRVAQGDSRAAESGYRQAIASDRRFLPAYLNLAELKRRQGEPAAAERLLRDAAKQRPEAAAPRLALGLMETRRNRSGEALAHFKAAHELAPENSRAAYIYAIALDSGSKTDAAVKVLKGIIARQPWDGDALQALKSYLAKSGRHREAVEVERKLEQLRGNP